jgi:hypothetical protein
MLTGQLLTSLLVTRLRLVALLDDHPEIADEPVRAPIVILGLPRTGTSHLHNLLAQDQALRSLPYWESLEPIPEPHRRGLAPESDPRRRRCERVLRFQHWVMPSRHARDDGRRATKRSSCWGRLLDHAVRGELPRARLSRLVRGERPDGRVPHAQLLLQALQWLRGPALRLVAATSRQLGPLPRVFPTPGWQTHRDPVRVTASMCTMATYGCVEPRLHRSAQRPLLGGLRRAYAAHVGGDGGWPAGQILDVRLTSSWRTSRPRSNASTLAEAPLGDTARRAMASYRDSHPPGGTEPSSTGSTTSG